MEHDITVVGVLPPQYEHLLSADALNFLSTLHQHFDEKRRSLLKRRVDIQNKIDEGTYPTFLEETKAIRDDLTWVVVPPPPDLQKRWVEITGPTDKKMLINALNSGADVFMADLEDANTPSWPNMLEGQLNLCDAVDGTLSMTTPEGKAYALKKRTAVLMVRPRGWHLHEPHILIHDEPISASLFDFGMYVYHNAKKLLNKGTAPYFYLPKLENHLEARLWNQVMEFTEQELGLEPGSIRVTVLIETILAAFEMEEILYELRNRITGLNAGRWDYIFSAIKKFKNRGDAIFPDRSEITMTVPFMRAYTQLLVDTCHKRNAHAIGGMAAFIPSRKNPEINQIALEKVRDDKLRESKDGFDGTWVAHPDLVPVAAEIFEVQLDKRDHQKDRRPYLDVKTHDLLTFQIPGAKVTEQGFRQNINVALQYLYSWLNGTGAVAINNLMEDTATAEICRAQLWQWIHHETLLDNGTPITAQAFEHALQEETQRLIREGFDAERLYRARQFLHNLVINHQFIEFLTLANG